MLEIISIYRPLYPEYDVNDEKSSEHEITMTAVHPNVKRPVERNCIMIMHYLVKIKLPKTFCAISTRLGHIMGHEYGILLFKLFPFVIVLWRDI